MNPPLNEQTEPVSAASITVTAWGVHGFDECGAQAIWTWQAITSVITILERLTETSCDVNLLTETALGAPVNL